LILWTVDRAQMLCSVSVVMGIMGGFAAWGSGRVPGGLGGPQAGGCCRLGRPWPRCLGRGPPFPLPR